jgi:AraC-like DNA-binding protein
MESIMAATIPLIRSGAIMPFILWMQANGRPIGEMLREVDLGYALKGDPNLPIPLGQAIAFLRSASRIEGPDFASRIVARSSVRELGMIGAVALNSGTVREALFRVAASIPLHMTNAIFSVSSAPGGVVVREAWGLRMDDETRHLVQQYATALMQALCANAGAALPVFGRIRLTPHPVHGLSHLHAWFGECVEASGDKTLELFVPAHVADRPLTRGIADDPTHETAKNAAPLRGDGTLSTSARIVVAAMLSESTPTVERLAAAAGLSTRTFQRRLREEGTTFSGLLESLRRGMALEGLADGRQTAGEIASRLGYGQKSSLTRAVRRWTGAPPRIVARFNQT